MILRSLIPKYCKWKILRIREKRVSPCIKTCPVMAEIKKNAEDTENQQVLTAPRFRVHHSNIKVVDFHHCTQLKTNVTPSNNDSLSILLCAYCFYELISIINFSQIKDVFGISSLDTKIRQPNNLQMIINL